MLSFRQGVIFLLITVCIIIVFLSSSTALRPSAYLPTKSTSINLTPPPNPGSTSSEVEDLERVCADHHAILYRDIESTEAYWNKVGGMTRDDLELSRHMCERDGNCATMKLYQGQLYIRHPISKEISFQSRAHSQLLMLSRIDFSHHEDADFLIDTNDGARIYEPCFLEMDKSVTEMNSKSRNESINHFLLPDFTSFDWWEAHLPSFNQVRMHLADSSGPFEEKIPKLFWRGAPKLQQGTQRTDLLNQLAPQTDIADIAYASEHMREHFKTLPEMCHYQYIIYTEGVTYSGRLKYTALCNSIQIGHNITFYEFWTHILEPYYVEVKDWDDAVRIYHELQADPERAAALARGPVETLREQLSPTGISCYIQRMMHAYSRSTRWSVLGPLDDVKGKNGTGDLVEHFFWVPLEHFLARALWMGTNNESGNWTKPIEWIVTGEEH